MNNPRMGRRTFLKVMGIGFGAGVLGACGGKSVSTSGSEGAIVTPEVTVEAELITSEVIQPKFELSACEPAHLDGNDVWVLDSAEYDTQDGSSSCQYANLGDGSEICENAYPAGKGKLLNVPAMGTSTDSHYDESGNLIVTRSEATLYCPFDQNGDDRSSGPSEMISFPIR